MSDEEQPLDERAQALLDFERDWASHAGRKGAQIKERFGVSSARYYQLLNRALEHPGAVAYDPFTVKRLRRGREQRSSRRRGSRALGERPGH